MQEPEQEYPLHQPGAGGHDRHHHPFDEQATPLPVEQPTAEPEVMHDRPLHQREEPSTPQLPRGRFYKALLAGVMIGILCAAQGIAIMVANAPLYNTAASFPTGKLPYQTALAIVGLNAPITLISAVIAIIGGFIVGKIVIQRRMGFLAGFVAGIITYGTGFLLNYIPNYPGHLPANGPTNAGGITGGLITALILLLAAGILAGLFSLLGAWLATRRHPYYVGYAG